MTPPAKPPPLPPALVQLPRLSGSVTLAVAVGLALAAPVGEQLDVGSLWWTLWVSTAAIALATFPLTMLVLWRNGRRIPVLDEGGAVALDPRGRPRRRRVELRGSRALFHGLVLEAATLLVLVATLLAAVGFGG